MAEAYRIGNHALGSVRLLAGLFMVLALACGTQNGTDGARPEQKTAEAGMGRPDRIGISQPGDRQQPHAPNEVLVKFKPGTDAETIERIRAALKLETLRTFSSPNLFLMRINDGSAVKTVIEELKAYEAVEYAEPNYVVKTTP